MVNKLVAALAAGSAMMLAASAAQALQFTGSYSVTPWTDTDNGLNIKTQNIAPGINLNLQVGVSQTIDLFKIWAHEEGTVNAGEDTIPRPITVDFSFTAPSPPFGGPVAGSTAGSTFFITVWNFDIPLFSYGEVDWTDPILLNFGANGDGELQIDLLDTTFNGGPGTSLIDGEEHGAIVTATFTLLKEASVDVPEPATLALFGLGLLGLGIARRRSTR